MSYGIAVSALFILNALPHWGFETLRKGARFFCKGDDNASSHRGKPTGTMASLEKKKAESGMQVHTKVKAFESTVGFILAEELYLEAKKKTYLERVPNFPIRALFPEAHDSFSFIAVPSSIRSQLKELQDGNCLARITQLLMCRYSKEYEGLRKMGVSVTGEHSIITWASDDGFPYNSKTVPGLYQRPVISGDYSSDCDIGDFVTAKKGFGADVDDSILPYMSHRMTEEKVRATLSTVPLISPYRRQPPYTKVPIGGVDSIGENLEKGLSKLRRQVETYPEIPLVGPTRHLQRKVKSSEGFRNPFDLENWTYKGFIPPGAVNNTGLPIAKPYDSDDSDDELFEPVENGIRLLQMATDHLPKRSLGGLHSDIRSLANGVAPVSHPLEPMSFEGLSTIPYHVILDMRNNFPKSFFERDESSSRGTTSKMAKHVSKLIMERFKKEWYTLPSPRVYWAVLEQPGTPRAVHITMSVLLVLSRPSRHNLGADSEVEYVTRKLWALGRKPIVFTHDKELQSRVRKVFK